MQLTEHDNPFEVYINHAKDFLQMIWEKILKLCLQIQNGLAYFFNTAQATPASTSSPVHSGNAPALAPAPLDEASASVSALSNSQSAAEPAPLDDANASASTSANASTDDDEVLSVHSELDEEPLASPGSAVVEHVPNLIEKMDPKLFFIFLGLMAKIFYIFVTAEHATDPSHHYLRPS